MKDRLDRTTWLNFALTDLAENGYHGLRAQPLAARLGVSRGSFYWHFEDVGSFHRALIAHWSEITNDALVADLATAGDAERRLTNLLRRTLRSGPALERAIRAWAATNAQVAELVDGVDARRIAYAADLLQDLGRGRGQAHWRAKLVYWAAIGRLMMMSPEDHSLSDAEIDALVKMMAP